MPASHTLCTTQKTRSFPDRHSQWWSGCSIWHSPPLRRMSCRGEKQPGPLRCFGECQFEATCVRKEQEVVTPNSVKRTCCVKEDCRYFFLAVVHHSCCLEGGKMVMGVLPWFREWARDAPSGTKHSEFCTYWEKIGIKQWF